ncbi:hypothetical protein SAMN05444159_4774 [Bradyrhizobium lablabi]|uniref:Uncharacterized protein n=1 Tax=Bradyrhizobium lablabi TaxID=722472 RepID=A0A1M6X635_9BRAD|nr:hypothetical protein [Bradyrhizobium lablabi]SHL01376.1 hypothetical protein SAMN05444159_4774 [Bradyrhizobium lablabi]
METIHFRPRPAIHFCVDFEPIDVNLDDESRGIDLGKAGIRKEYTYVQFLSICHWTPAPFELLEGDAILFPYL